MNLDIYFYCKGVDNMNSIYEELDELIMKGDKVKLKKAIKSLKNINMKDKDGQTLLDYAIFRGNRKLVKALLFTMAVYSSGPVTSFMQNLLSLCGIKSPRLCHILAV